MTKPNEISRKIRTHLEMDGTGDPRLWLGPAADEIDRLHELINAPHVADFLEATRLEAAHQVERWGEPHDRAKEPADWFWLVGYLAGKALAAHIAGDEDKALHHTISSAAVLMQWHAHISGRGTGFTPGASDLQQHLQATVGVGHEETA